MITKFEIHALLIQNRNGEERENMKSPSEKLLGEGKGEIPLGYFIGAH